MCLWDTKTWGLLLLCVNVSSRTNGKFLMLSSSWKLLGFSLATKSTVQPFHSRSNIKNRKWSPLSAFYCSCQGKIYDGYLQIFDCFCTGNITEPTGPCSQLQVDSNIWRNNHLTLSRLTNKVWFLCIPVSVLDAVCGSHTHGFISFTVDLLLVLSKGSTYIVAHHFRTSI